MVCGTDKTKSVSIKNVVYREIFDPHSQIEPMEDIDEICSLLNDTFPSSQLTITSPLLDTVTPAKRESVLSGADGKGKIIKLNEFNDNTLIPLEPTDTRMDTECVFDRILRNPLGHSEILPNSSFNNFTIEMRLKLAQSLGIDGAFILPVREIHRIFSNYYSSLKIQLIDYFGVSISLYSVKPDGKSLYRALSHLILGNQEYYDILKNKLIAKFVNSHNHHFNVMRQSGILSDQELQEHIKSVSERNAWGTNVELCMLGAIAGIDTVILDCIDANSANWNVRQNYIHSLLEVPLQCDAIFEGQKLCVLHHRLNHHLGNEHFDSFYLQ